MSVLSASTVNSKFSEFDAADDPKTVGLIAIVYAGDSPFDKDDIQNAIKDDPNLKLRQIDGTHCLINSISVESNLEGKQLPQSQDDQVCSTVNDVGKFISNWILVM